MIFDPFERKMSKSIDSGCDVHFNEEFSFTKWEASNRAALKFDGSKCSSLV